MIQYVDMLRHQEGVIWIGGLLIVMLAPLALLWYLAPLPKLPPEECGGPQRPSRGDK